MVEKLIQLSMDLYDIESGTTLSVESNHLVINFGGKRQITLWVADDILLPETVHDFEEPKTVEFEIVEKVMELIEKHEEDSK